MTTEEKLAHFLEASVEENTRISDEMLKNYQATLDEQFAAHKERILQQAAAELDNTLEALRREGNKQLAHEHLIIKRTLSQKNKELTDKLFEEVNSLLEDYKKTPEYLTLLTGQIRSAKEFARYDNITFYIDPQDADKKEALEKATGCILNVSQYSFGGGTRAVIPARHILIDNSFVSRIAEQRDNFHFAGGKLHD